jgi:hypothetical protein
MERMTDEFKLLKDTERAQKAQQLLDNEILADAFKTLKAAYLEQLMATNVMQTDVREKCYLAMRVVDVVEAHLKTIISNGKLAQSDLKHLAETAERRKKFGTLS